MYQLPAKRPAKLRLSLLSLLLVMTCLAMCLGLWLAMLGTDRAVREMRTAQDENRRLRKEYGEFAVKDEGRLYAQELRLAWHADEELRYRSWAWRVWTPKSRRYKLNYAEGMVPQTGIPTPTSSRPLDPGFQTIRLRFDYNPSLSEGGSDQWTTRLWIGNEQPRVRSTLPTKSPAWPELLYPGNGRGGVSLPGETIGRFGTAQPDGDRPFDGPYSQPADKRAVLQRLRFAPVDEALLANPNAVVRELIDESVPAPGFMIWIEPQP